ncbi:MAG TPA: HAMP domain-containing sensor histidine kinase [Methylomirabilota bacterium]|nr:HAMP domain-containing sensor histidine kinase [Methylomirabilota bacterium]
MTAAPPSPPPRARQRWVPWLVIGSTLAVLAGVILLAREQVRATTRRQLAGRDAAVLHAVALLQWRDEVTAAGVPEALHDPATQLTAMLKTARLDDVLALRLFTAEGRFLEAFPVNVLEDELSGADLERLRRGEPTARFRPTVPLTHVFWPETAEAAAATTVAPLLEVNVPLRTADDPAPAGIAQFILEGHSLAAEFERLDRVLNLQAAVAFAGAGGLLFGVMLWAFHRLKRAQELLARRTRDLLQANQELSFAAKASAIGAVSAHLIHGLKNPLAGLQSLVAHLAPTGGELQQALATTRRMQALINQVVTVLREEEVGTHYELTLAELAEIALVRVQALATERNVRLATRVEGAGVLSNRDANLTTLILVNLLQNAIEATPAGGCVRLEVRGGDVDHLLAVRDEGPGLPPQVRQRLFSPCVSTKPGGGGIGLAISHQLALHLEATLCLREEAGPGCVFELRVPVKAGRAKGMARPPPR